MSYNNLIIFLTDRCRSGCSTCNVRAVPGNSGMLKIEDIDSFLSDPDVSGSNKKYIIWTGGEPFENFSVLEYGIAMAGNKKFRSEILSSGYWFRDTPEMLTELVQKGNFSLRISIDSEHILFSGEDLLLDLTGECLKKNIELNFTVRDLPGDESASKILNSIKINYPDYTSVRMSDPRWIHHIPHVPIDKNDPYSLPETSSLNNTGCKLVFRDLVVGWSGDVYPCCGLFSLPGFEKYSTGNIRNGGRPELQYKKVVELFRMIGEHGPSGIFQKFDPTKTKGLMQEFGNQCHACLYFLRKYDVQLKNILSG